MESSSLLAYALGKGPTPQLLVCVDPLLSMEWRGLYLMMIWEGLRL